MPQFHSVYSQKGRACASLVSLLHGPLSPRFSPRRNTSLGVSPMSMFIRSDEWQVLRLLGGNQISVDLSDSIKQAVWNRFEWVPRTISSIEYQYNFQKLSMLGIKQQYGNISQGICFSGFGSPEVRFPILGPRSRVLTTLASQLALALPDRRGAQVTAAPEYEHLCYSYTATMPYTGIGKSGAAELSQYHAPTKNVRLLQRSPSLGRVHALRARQAVELPR